MDFVKDFFKLQQGFKGEEIIRKILAGKRMDFMQADLISLSKNNKVYLWEIKHKERFLAPPFDGHGLSIYQFKFFLKLSKIIPIIPIFVVIETEKNKYDTNYIFMQDMRKLNNLPDSKKFITKSGKIIIFDLNEFEKREYLI